MELPKDLFTDSSVSREKLVKMQEKPKERGDNLRAGPQSRQRERGVLKESALWLEVKGDKNLKVIVLRDTERKSNYDYYAVGAVSCWVLSWNN